MKEVPDPQRQHERYLPALIRSWLSQGDEALREGAVAANVAPPRNDGQEAHSRAVDLVRASRQLIESSRKMLETARKKRSRR